MSTKKTAQPKKKVVSSSKKKKTTPKKQITKKVTSKKPAFKKAIKKIVKKAPAKKVAKKTVKTVVPAKPKHKPKPITIRHEGQGTRREVNSEKRLKELEAKAQEIIDKGKKRGFITYDEILKSFPDIENNILFLDELYEKFNTAGIDVLEGGNLLDVDANEDLTKYTRDTPSHSSVQMYLKDIGQYPLINGAQEKELARRILAGDDEARTLLARSNLRLVVSIAKKLKIEGVSLS